MTPILEMVPSLLAMMIPCSANLVAWVANWSGVRGSWIIWVSLPQGGLGEEGKGATTHFRGWAQMKGQGG